MDVLDDQHSRPTDAQRGSRTDSAAASRNVTFDNLGPVKERCGSDTRRVVNKRTLRGNSDKDNTTDICLIEHI